MQINSGQALFPHDLPLDIKYGEDAGGSWLNIWMMFLKKIHVFTGKTYPRGKAIDVGLEMAAGGREKLMEFVSLAIDDRSKQIYLGVTYKKEYTAYKEKYGIALWR